LTFLYQIHPSPSGGATSVTLQDQTEAIRPHERLRRPPGTRSLEVDLTPMQRTPNGDLAHMIHQLDSLTTLNHPRNIENITNKSPIWYKGFDM
jgi:hypothetical protein